MAWLNTGRGDGSGGPGTPDSIVAEARAHGILWINAAGNFGQSHWMGGFADGDGDGFHELVAGDEVNTFQLPGGGNFACVALKWDDWPLLDQDYDLYLIDTYPGEVVSSLRTFRTAANHRLRRRASTTTDWRLLPWV